MFKKVSFLLKIIIISTVWSIIYFILARSLFLYLWNFDILITENWLKILKFWNAGGVINKLKDFIFVLSLLVILPIWLYCLIKLIKYKFVNLIIIPINAYNNYITKKYGSSSSRIVFRNISSGKKEGTSIEDMVNIKMKEIDEENNKELEATKIRNVIKEKIQNKK